MMPVDEPAAAPPPPPPPPKPAFAPAPSERDPNAPRIQRRWGGVRVVKEQEQKTPPAASAPRAKSPSGGGVRAHPVLSLHRRLAFRMGQVTSSTAADADADTVAGGR